MRSIKFNEAINEALSQAMELNQDVIVLGRLFALKSGFFTLFR